MEIKPYILWISDIHYSMSYDDDLINKINGKKRFDYLWDKFIDHIHFLDNNVSRFTHIIISGDLIMTGVMDEVNMFSNKIIKLYTDVFTHDRKPKLLICPGNHDVSWDFLETAYLKFRETGYTEIKDFYKFLNGVSNEILDAKKKMFNDYRQFYFNLERFGIVKTNSSEFLKNYCFNYFDSEFNILFRIINSSSNSHGDGVHSLIKIILKDILSDSGKTGAMEALIEMSTKIKEQGNQIYLAEALSEIDKGLLNESDPIVISIAHHPIHEWLLYSQIYNMDQNSIVNQIYNYSHLHLTSHEHIDPSEYYLYFKDQCLSLKSGKFCDRELESKEDVFTEIFNSNWFSTIEINIKSMELVHSNYKFMFSDSNNAIWEDKSNGKVHKLIPKEMRLNSLVEKIYTRNEDIIRLTVEEILKLKIELDQNYNEAKLKIEKRITDYLN